MPIEVRNVNGGLGVIIVGRGAVGEREYVDALRKHLTQDEETFKKYRYSLSDYTAVTSADISTEAIRSIAELCKSAAIVNPAPVVAAVAGRDYVYGLVRMSQAIRDDGRWESMVFRNREDAEAWIRERVRAKYGIEDLTFD